MNLPPPDADQETIDAWVARQLDADTTTVRGWKRRVLKPKGERAAFYRMHMRVLQISAPNAEANRVVDAARRRGVSITTVVRWALADWLQREDGVQREALPWMTRPASTSRPTAAGLPPPKPKRSNG